jgi:hypothetical protein
MSRPFGREDARKRAESCRNQADAFRMTLREIARVSVNPITDDDGGSFDVNERIFRKRIRTLEHEAKVYDLVAKGQWREALSELGADSND